MYRIAIIEDEILARERLRKLLKPYTAEIALIGEATDGQEGMDLIESLKPDAVFLDVQMPIMNGFEMLRNLSIQPYVIFTTAFDRYAIKAFEENSIDYLLKPIEEERLKRSIEKLKLRSSSQDAVLNLLLDKLEKPSQKTISVSLGERIILLKLEEVAFFHAEDKYVFAHDHTGKKHLLNTSLKELEEKLGNPFLRIHRAYLINCDFVKEIHKSSNSKLEFCFRDADHSKIASSHGYTPDIRKKFQL